MRAEEMALAPWTAGQKRAFLDDQFRLQRLHYRQVYRNADYWIVETTAPLSDRRVGRFYLDRSTPLWRVIDLGLLPVARSRGMGGSLLIWTQDNVRAAGAEGLDLHVMTTNPRAETLYRRLGFEVTGEDGVHRHMLWRA